MLNILILEDSLDRVKIFNYLIGNRVNITTVDNAEEAIALLEKERYDVLFLDHDLGGQPPFYYGVNCDINDINTGSEVVRWMLATDVLLEQPIVFIHSMNEPAAVSMEGYLKDADFEFVYRVPFSRLVDQLADPRFLT